MKNDFKRTEYDQTEKPSSQPIVMFRKEDL